MNRLAVIVGWICVGVTAVFLRIDDLGARPFHADEATGARITAQRMDGEAAFDPTHYHGPILADAAGVVCRLRGEDGWNEMSKTTLRIVPMLAGVLLVLMPLLLRRRFGDLPMLAIAAFLATSPLLVYYSRMFIHESLLVLFGVGALALWLRKPDWGLPGLMLGLMFAAKESFVISGLAWAGAAMVLLLENRKLLTRQRLIQSWHDWWQRLAWSAAVALITMLVFYTHGFTHWQGAVDAVKTFFVYETVEGHDKAFGYYVELLVVPFKSGGVWWFGTPVVLLAIWAYANTFWGSVDAASKASIRFLAYAAVGHFLIYSCFDYKTPWLACLPWAHVCILAGFGFYQFQSRHRVLQVAVALLAIICLVTQYRQARYASGRLAADPRNPFAYVPTRKPVERLERWLNQMDEMRDGGAIGRLAVVGQGYWPLPWYLRSLGNAGYWATPVPELVEFPVVLSMPGEKASTEALLEGTHHQAPFGYGLRPGVNVEVFVRNDLYEQWISTD